MPMLREIIQFTVLALAVPLQLYICGYFTDDSTTERFPLVTKNLLTWQYWRKVCADLFDKLAIWRRLSGSESDVNNEDAANIDGRKYRGSSDGPEDGGVMPVDFNDPVVFAGSEEPRSPRPPSVRYHIGQVVRHRDLKFRGLIVGWDERARAPKRWLEYLYGDRVAELSAVANYKVIIDIRDRRHPQFAYIAEPLLEVVVDGTRVQHPELDTLFESFDAASNSYSPRPILQKVYPHDDPRKFRDREAI